MNKRGSIEALTLMVASVAAFAIFLIIIGYLGNAVGTEFRNKLNDSAHFAPSINDSITKTIDVSTQMLGSVWYIVFGGLILAVLVSAYFVKSFPLLLPVFFFLLITAILLGVAMSNAYEQITENATLSTAAAQQASVGFMMDKLPYIAFVVGIMAAIIIFAVPKREATAIM